MMHTITDELHVTANLLSTCVNPIEQQLLVLRLRKLAERTRRLEKRWTRLLPRQWKMSSLPASKRMRIRSSRFMPHADTSFSRCRQCATLKTGLSRSNVPGTPSKFQQEWRTNDSR